MTPPERDETLIIGVEPIDAEHRQLQQLFADFGAAIEAGCGVDVLSATIERIMAYSAYHFRHEEELFSRTTYPEAEAHCAEHDALARRLMDIQGKLRFGATPLLASELGEFIQEWTVNHVWVADRGMVPYLKQLED